MSPKRGDLVAPPPIEGEWKVKFSTNEAIKGWAALEVAAPNKLRWAWDIMRTDPGPGLGKPTARHCQLKGSLATARHGGRELPQWEIEVTSGGRIFYLFDEKLHTIWVNMASSSHPKITE